MALIDGSSRPTPKEAARGLLLRAIAPGILVWLVIVGFGELLRGPLKPLNHTESGLNADLARDRTARWNTITMVWSHVGNTEIVIGVCVLAVALLWWRTREWWVAIIPAIAISLQATIFVIATAIIGRPRPEVPKLDPAPPTSSYPSGHVGASTALYLSLALIAASRIERPWLRRLVVVLCAVIPFLVAYARLYRGMHHLSDVLIGALNGIACALLAWTCLRSHDRHQARPSRHEVS
jgi:membrane-associated phospholipid phosphatase